MCFADGTKLSNPCVIDYVRDVENILTKSRRKGRGSHKTDEIRRQVWEAYKEELKIEKVIKYNESTNTNQ